MAFSFSFKSVAFSQIDCDKLRIEDTISSLHHTRGLTIGTRVVKHYVTPSDTRTIQFPDGNPSGCTYFRAETRQDIYYVRASGLQP